MNVWKRHSVGRSRSEQKKEQEKKKKKACRLQNKENDGLQQPNRNVCSWGFLDKSSDLFYQAFESKKKKLCVCGQAFNLVREME